MNIQELKTRIFKGREGWEGKTVRTEKGQTFEICTMKRYSGDLVSTVWKVKVNSGADFITTSFGMNDSFMSISHGKARCTENTVKDAHYKALAAFDVKIDTLPNEEIRPEVPEIGDILFMDGYGKSKGSHANNWIIYKIENTVWGLSFHCIEKDTLELRLKDHVRPWSKKFGIGIYFEKGFNQDHFKISENDLSNMLIEAQDVARAAAAALRTKEAAAATAAAKRTEYLSQFTAADVRKTTAIIKSHGLKNYPVSKIEVKTDSFSGGTSMHVTYYAPVPVDSFEKFIKNFQYGHFDGMNDIYEYSNSQDIIIDGYILNQYKYVSSYFIETTAADTTETPTEKTAFQTLEEKINACQTFQQLNFIMREILTAPAENQMQLKAIWIEKNKAISFEKVETKLMC